MGRWCCRMRSRFRLGRGSGGASRHVFVVEATPEILRFAQDDKFSRGFALAAGAGGFGFGDEANDGAFAGRAWLAVVADEKMFDDFIDAGVLEARELGVFVKRNIARAPDEAQAAEDSAGFTLEGL
jgi:hypothetical protein